MEGAVYAFGDCEVDLGRYEVRRDGAVVHVEPKVFDVLAALVADHDRVVSKQELLDRVWGSRFVSESALTTRIRAARSAIGDDGQAQAMIRTVHGRGYRFVAAVQRLAPSVSPSVVQSVVPSVVPSWSPVDAPAPAAPTAPEPAPDRSASAVPPLAVPPVDVTPVDVASPDGALPDAARPDVTVSDEPPAFERSRFDQEIHFCRTPDGTLLAWATIGDGPPLVKAANWMTHLDYDWETPVWRHWLEGLATGRRLVRYDERGCGLSDWDVSRFEFAAWVDDLAHVVDAAGLDRFPLLGVSQGAAVAIAYAVAHPERVSCLVLLGSYARGRLVRATTDEQRREAALDLELARVGWGRDEPTFRQVFTARFLPDGTPDEWAEFNELQRRSISTDNAVRFLEEFAIIDVADLAAQVTCPTLILHSRDDMRVPLANAREIASLIPNSRLVPLDSRNHLLRAREPAWPVFLDELDRFVSRHNVAAD